MMRTYGRATWADTDPRGCLHGARTLTRLIGPTSIGGLGKRIGDETKLKGHRFHTVSCQQ